MTEEEMTQITLDYWRQFHKKLYKKLGPERALREARACAHLTKMEMDTLKLMVLGMTDDEAWTEARTLFCLANHPENLFADLKYNF